MEYTEILKMVDHTLLKQDATWEEIKSICDDGMRYSTASVCIPASYVKQAAEYVCGKVPICTVIGFPNGYSTTATKLFETQDAIKNGADEIDMVINIGWLKDKKYDDILAEIKAIKAVCSEKILKVIIETCLLTNEEKIKMCEIVSLSGADFIKTSTGFSTGGATAADIQLFANHVAPHVKIKAAGGISYISDAEDFIEFGASRLGTSKLVKLLAEGKHPVGEIIKWINDDYLRYSSSQNNPSYAFARLWEDIALECYAEDDIDEEIIMYNLVTAKLNLDKGSIINGTRYSIPKVMSYYEKMKDRIRAYYSQEDNKIIDDMVAEIYSKRNLWEK